MISVSPSVDGRSRHPRAFCVEKDANKTKPIEYGSAMLINEDIVQLYADKPPV